MEVLNYTGKYIGLTNGSIPIESLPSDGKATCEIEIIKIANAGRFPIYKKNLVELRDCQVQI